VNFARMLVRQRCPKNAKSTHPDMSMIGARGKEEGTVYFTERYLKVGHILNVFTRQLRLMGCDRFTRDYYVRTYGADPEDYHDLVIEDEKEELAKMMAPSHAGLGTEEDSLASFLYLDPTKPPRVPRVDYRKLVELEGIHLRYLAKFVDPAVEDRERRFIITYYLNNDTTSVFERLERNSGFVGGKFLERSRVKNPETGFYFKATDFALGRRVRINAYNFEIIEVDQYTNTYMRDNFGADHAAAPGDASTTLMGGAPLPDDEGDSATTSSPPSAAVAPSSSSSNKSAGTRRSFADVAAGVPAPPLSASGKNGKNDKQKTAAVNATSVPLLKQSPSAASAARRAGNDIVRHTSSPRTSASPHAGRASLDTKHRG